LPIGIPSLGLVDEFFIKTLLTIMNEWKEKFSIFKSMLKQFEVLTLKEIPNQIIEFTGKPKYSLPYPTRGAYDKMPNVNKFNDIFFNQLLPRYSNPPIRDPLNFYENEEGAIVIKCKEKILIKFTPSQKSKNEEILFIFYFVYLPLTWEFEVEWKMLKQMILKAEGKKYGPKMEIEKCSNLLNSVLLQI
jgi:hypothetical protein